MKRGLLVLVLLWILTGCGNGQDYLDRAMGLRQQLLKAESCSFDANITADYGDCIYNFTMHCITDSSGELTFEVVEPSSIAGIRGTVSAYESKLTFDDQILTFAPIADGQITPVLAPWVFIHTLKSGYLNACSKNDSGLMLCIDDSYQDEALTLNIQLDDDDIPINGEILWKGKRVLSVVVSNFTIL